MFFHFSRKRFIEEKVLEEHVWFRTLNWEFLIFLSYEIPDFFLSVSNLVIQHISFFWLSIILWAMKLSFYSWGFFVFWGGGSHKKILRNFLNSFARPPNTNETTFILYVPNGGAITNAPNWHLIRTRKGLQRKCTSALTLQAIL